MKTEYQIIEDKVKGDFIIQVFLGKNLGWSFVTTKNSYEKAKQWILEGLK
jgi:hypothetical protein